MVAVLRVGVDIGAKTFTPREDEREVVKTKKIAKAMGQLMGDDTDDGCNLNHPILCEGL